MLYTKNLPGWERAMRIAVGVILIVTAVFVFPTMPFRYGTIILGCVALLTAFVGFCPACAMFGRKLGR